MKYIDPSAIICLFDDLNRTNLPYILLRNIDSELPNRLKNGKDIDILIPYKEKTGFTLFLKQQGFKSMPHPHRTAIMQQGVKKNEFFINRDNILLDISYQLSRQNLNTGHWVPLDKKIQDNVWKNRLLNTTNNFRYFSMAPDDEFVLLVVRSIFVKRIFKSGYIRRIEELFESINMEYVIPKLELVFSKFTNLLLNLLRSHRYDIILEQYISFKDYQDSK